MAFKNIQGDVNILGNIKVSGSVKSETNQPLNLESGNTHVNIPYSNEDDYVKLSDLPNYETLEFDENETYYRIVGGEYREYAVTSATFSLLKSRLYIFETAPIFSIAFPQKSGDVVVQETNGNLLPNSDSINGTAYNSAYITYREFPMGNYTFNAENSSPIAYTLNVKYKDETTTNFFGTSGTPINITFSLDVIYLSLSFDDNVTNAKATLVSGDESKEYEQFVGNVLYEKDTIPAVLWSDTFMQSFAPKTITTMQDMSKFKYIVIGFAENYIDGAITYAKFKYVELKTGHLVSAYASSSSSVVATRTFKFLSSTEIQFFECPNGNENIIPIEIYGTNLL